MTDANPRIRARIPNDLWMMLKMAVVRDGNSQSKIISAALASHFSYEVDDQRDAQILERMDLQTRNHHRLSRDMNLLTETVSLFLQYFFTMAPRVPESEKDARAAQGLVDYNQFIDRLGHSMGRGGKTLKTALDDVLISDVDFFKMEEFELLESLLKKRTTTPRISTGSKKKASKSNKGDGDE